MFWRDFFFFFFFCKRVNLQTCHTLNLGCFFFSIEKLLFGSHLLNLSVPPFPHL